jgi:hypothetical protein
MNLLASMPGHQRQFYHENPMLRAEDNLINQEAAYAFLSQTP